MSVLKASMLSGDLKVIRNLARSPKRKLFEMLEHSQQTISVKVIRNSFRLVAELKQKKNLNTVHR